MTIKKKLLIALSLLAILPMLVSVTVSTWVAGDSTNTLLVAQAKQQLGSFRDSRKNEVNSYLSQTRKMLISFSQSKMVSDLLDEFAYSAPGYPGQNQKVTIEETRKALFDYFQKNPLGENFSARAHVDSLPDFAAVMQYRYIATNEHPAGERHNLIYSQDLSTYSEAHRRYQQEVIDYMAENDVYDIYLVEFEGTILYSSRKEVDFGTSLKDGMFSDSELGRLYTKLESADYTGDVPLNTDFISYIPSGDRQTLFMGTLIKQHSMPMGILIFQLTGDAIDRIMTNNQNWQSSGLGKTGQAYLFGADKTMRSNNRVLLETPDKYYELMAKDGVPESTVSKIRSSGSSIGRQTVDTSPVRLAQQGKTGFEVFEKANGSRMLSAYTQLEADSLDWYILAEMEEQEANAPAIAFTKRILLISVAAAALVALIAVISGWLFTKRLVRPIEKLASEIDHIESNSDLGFTLSGDSSDVTIDIVNSMNKMLSTLHGTISTVAQNSTKLSQAALNIDQISEKAHHDVQRQGIETNNIAEEVNGLIQSINQSDEDAESAHQAAKTATDCVESGRDIVEATTRSVSKLDSEITRASEIIGNLAKSSHDVGNVLGVISSIAEQTNLLALNAAIEAARAGEQGRGFAVVADEVRTLASRTQDSTEEVRKIINALQSYATDAVDVMESGLAQGKKSVERTNKTSEALQEIVDSIGAVAGYNNKIAVSSKSQRVASEQVSGRISVVGDIAEATTDGAQQTRHASDEINQLSSHLNEAVSTFKLRDS